VLSPDSPAQCSNGRCAPPTRARPQTKAKTKKKVAKKKAPRCPAGCECPCAGGACRCRQGQHCTDGDCCCFTGDPIASADSMTRPPVSQNFGVDRGKLHTDERYRINGRTASKQEVQSRLARPAGGAVPDDAARPRLTVIGPEPERRPVLRDLDTHPALAEWKNKLLVQAYPPDHWQVARAGFLTAGRPTIYLQTPGGAVLHRQDDYSGGAGALADALRKADPSYRPERDRDRRRPDLLPRLLSLPKLPWSAGVLAATAVVLLWPRRKS
jgi:hypothetical protein